MYNVKWGNEDNQISRRNTFAQNNPVRKRDPLYSRGIHQLPTICHLLLINCFFFVLSIYVSRFLPVLSQTVYNNRDSITGGGLHGHCVVSNVISFHVVYSFSCVPRAVRCIWLLLYYSKLCVSWMSQMVLKDQANLSINMKMIAAFFWSCSCFLSHCSCFKFRIFSFKMLFD